MALPDLTGQNIENTYQRVLQTDGTVIYDGTGSIFLPVSASYAVTASYAEYAVSASHEIIKEVSSSYADYAKESGLSTSSISASYALTASYALNSPDTFPYTGSAIISGSLTVTGSTEIQHLTASGLNYPTTDGGEKQLITTDSSGNLSFDWSDRTNIDVKNTSGTTLEIGTPVYISGFQGASIFQISAASSSLPGTMPAVGILDQTLNDNDQGYATLLGAVRGIDTNTPGYSTNQSLYVGEGTLTPNRPTGSALIQKIARVGSVANNGEITVLGAGRSNDIPNLQPGYAWVGDSTWNAIATPTSSFNEDPFPYTGSAIITGSLEITGSIGVLGPISASQIQLGTATIYSGSTRTSIGVGRTPYYYAGNNAVTADAFYSYNGGSAGAPALYLGSNGGGAGRGIYAVNQGIAFSANNSTIAYIRGRTNDSSGNDTPRIGIGVDPSAHIDLSAHINSTRNLLRISGSSAATHAEAFFISSSGNTGIGTWSPNYKLEVVGDVSASTYYGDGSNLTGISSDPFPYTGSAVISGSLDIQSNQDDALTIGGNINNTAPSFIKFTNGGSGVSTGASIEFPFGQLIRGVYSPDGFTFYDKNQTNNVKLSSTNLQFSQPGTISFGGNSNTSTIQNASGTGAILKYKVGGYHSFESYNGSFFEVARIDNQGIDVIGAVSASTYYGDGSNLTGISSDPFPYTGSAIISGSLEVIGDTNITGSINLQNSSTNRINFNNAAAINQPQIRLKDYATGITMRGNDVLALVSNGSGMIGMKKTSATSINFPSAAKVGFTTNTSVESYNPETYFRRYSSGVIGIGYGAVTSANLSGSLILTNITASGHISASTYYGDGSNLTGISSDPFPYTGSAIISGSLEVTGSFKALLPTSSNEIYFLTYNTASYELEARQVATLINPKVEYLDVTASIFSGTSITLPNGLSYISSSAYEYLEVFFNGLRLRYDRDFVPTSTTTIQNQIAFPSGSELTFKSLKA